MNTERVKEIVMEKYGEVHPVQLEGIVDMIIQAGDKYGFDNIIMWKMDLQGAYNLLFFRPEDAGILAMELKGGLSMISLVGHFGWTGTPFAFDVASRTLVRGIRQRIEGLCEIATDDIIGVSGVNDVVADMAIADEFIHQIFVAKCVNDEKTEADKLIEAIGWKFDLTNRKVGIAKHNLHKTLYGFIEAETADYLAVKELMKLASWSSRYTKICRFMRPFTSFLHSITAGRTNYDVMVEITVNVRQIIRLWSSFLTLMLLHPLKFERTIDSFRKEIPQFSFNLDASLTGIGVIGWKCSITGVESEPIIVARYVTSYEFGSTEDYESSNQNSMEFIAILFAMIILAIRGVRNIAIHIEGDSRSSLAWSRNEKFRSHRVVYAAMFYIILAAETGMYVVDTNWIAGKRNIVSDEISRGMHPRELGYSDDQIVELENSTIIRRIFELINPSQHNKDLTLSSDVDFESKWIEMREIVGQLLLLS